MGDTETLLTIKQVAERLGKTEDWVYRQCLSNRMPHRRLGRTRVLTEGDLAEFLDRSRNVDPMARVGTQGIRRRRSR